MQHGAVVFRQTEIIFPIEIRHTGHDIILVFPVDGANIHKVRDVFRGLDASRKAVYRCLDHDAALGLQSLLVGDEIAHGIIEHDWFARCIEYCISILHHMRMSANNEVGAVVGQRLGAA